MADLLVRGSQGAEVHRLLQQLARQLGDDAQAFGALGAGQLLDADAEAAVRRWQAGVGLVADGMIGAALPGRCWVCASPVSWPSALTLDAVRQPVSGHQAGQHRALPALHRAALGVAGLTDRAMVVRGPGHHPRRDRGLCADLRVPVEVQHPARRRRLSACTTTSLGNNAARRRRALSRARLRAADGRDELRRPTAASSASTWPTGPDLANAPGSRRRCCWRVFLADKADRPSRRRCRQQRRSTSARTAGQRRLARAGELQDVFDLAKDVWPPTAGRRPEAAGARRTPRPPESQHKRLAHAAKTPPTCATDIHAAGG